MGILKKRARQLRSNQTDAEKKLWHQLRAKRLHGFKFRRQAIIGSTIVDFVCMQKKLVIELDGGQHADHQQKDAIRTQWLEHHGYRVLRFWNLEVFRNIQGVLLKIQERLLIKDERK